jgi:hypothetical protein
MQPTRKTMQLLNDIALAILFGLALGALIALGF